MRSVQQLICHLAFVSNNGRQYEVDRPQLSEATELTKNSKLAAILCIQYM